MTEPESGTPVNHPPHYNKHPSGVECIDIIEWLPFNLGNAVKYVWRAGEKGNEIEDLEKARWYLEREIDGGVRKFCGAGELSPERKEAIRQRVLDLATSVVESDYGILGRLLVIVVAAQDLKGSSKQQYLPLLRTAQVLLSEWIVQARLGATGARGSE